MKIPPSRSEGSPDPFDFPAFPGVERRGAANRFAVPEYPDVIVYVEALQSHVMGRRLERLQLFNPFLLRTVTPSVDAVAGQVVREVRRVGKRIVLGMENDIFIVIHLMIAGRLRWRPPSKKIGGKLAQAALTFEHGTVWLTEAARSGARSCTSSKGKPRCRRSTPVAWRYWTRTCAAFADALRSKSHTLKRS